MASPARALPDVAGAGVVLGTVVAGGAVVGGRVVVGGAVVGAVVVVGGRVVVTGGLAGLALWLLLVEPQAGRPNATAVRASAASLVLMAPTIGASVGEAVTLAKSRTGEPYPVEGVSVE